MARGDVLTAYVSKKLAKAFKTCPKRREEAGSEREEEAVWRACRPEELEVGSFVTKSYGLVNVFLDIYPPDGTYTVSAYDRNWNEIGESAEGTELFGYHELTLRDGSKIEFDVIIGKEPPNPRDWSPRMKKPTMGLHTREERSRALVAAQKMLQAVTKGDHYDQLVAYGYFMAIRDMAHDEGHPELADKMEEFMEKVRR